MTDEERELCWGLVTQPDGTCRISSEDFLQRFPSAVEQGKVASHLLEQACAARDADDLLCALIVGFVFGFRPEQVQTLCPLVDEDWHASHEDVVSALDDLRTPAAVDALFLATQWIPEYLDYDEARALAVKAIWGLGNLPCSLTNAKLERLTQSDDPILRKNAVEQLARTDRPQ